MSIKPASMIENPYYEEWKKEPTQRLSFEIGDKHPPTMDSREWCFNYALRHSFPYDDVSDDEIEMHSSQTAEINEWVKGFTHKYAWGIPNEEVLDKIAEFSPLVEIGAGTGYWAYLLRKMGVDVLAFDCCPPSTDLGVENVFHTRAVTWTDVLSGDESVLESIVDRTLFLCWPPENSPMAFNTLSKYKGNTLLFVGIDQGHATGDPTFFELLDEGWNLEGDCQSVDIPRWPGRTDALWIYHRKR
jgi:hypothetical protein